MMYKQFEQTQSLYRKDVMDQVFAWCKAVLLYLTSLVQAGL